MCRTRPTSKNDDNSTMNGIEYAPDITVGQLILCDEHGRGITYVFSAIRLPEALQLTCLLFQVLIDLLMVWPNACRDVYTFYTLVTHR